MLMLKKIMLDRAWNMDGWHLHRMQGYEPGLVGYGMEETQIPCEYLVSRKLSI